MKIADLNLSEIFRFAITGIGFYFVLLFSEIKIEKDFSKIELSIVVFVVGILLYYLYRTIIFPLIHRFVDWINPYNMRRYIEDVTDLKDWDEKNDLWMIICNSNYEKLDVDKGRIWSHSIHMMYIISILALIGVMLTFITNLNFVRLNLFIFIFIVFSFAAIKSDLSIEKRIYRNFIFFYNSELDSMINKYIENKKTMYDKSTQQKPATYR